MRRGTDGSLLYSPTDLVNFLASPFATWMDRLRLERPDSAPQPDEEDAGLKLVAAEGDRHEQAWLARLRAERGDVTEIDKNAKNADAASRAAIAAGHAVVYQARLATPPFAGFSDFLERVDVPSRLGAFSYEVVDTKLARSPKPYFLIQLCAYAEMLEDLQGVRPARVHVVLGTGERRTYRTDDYFYAYRATREAFLAQMAAFDPDRPPEPDPTADHGRWASHAETWAVERDHLSQVAEIRKSQIKKLERAGVTTVAALAASRLPRVPKLDDAVFARLRDQAALQVRARGGPADAAPPFEILRPDADAPRRGLALLPPAAPLDVYADFEGYPLAEGGGLEYLFGATTEDGGARRFHDWWAHDRDEEKAAFAAFMDFLYDRWKRDPATHVYHYAPYETSALKRLAGRYGVRESELDDLLRAEVFVDLYRVVRQGLRVGAPSYSIKKIERLYRPARAGGVATAGDSIVAYRAWIDSGEPRDWRASPLLRGIRDYNQDDCESTADLARWLRERQTECGIPWVSPAHAAAAAESADDDASAAAAPPSDARLAAERRTALAQEILGAASAVATARPDDAERRRKAELLAHVLEFHRREKKPMWWALFERAAMTQDQLVDDADCLGGLRRSPEPPTLIKKTRAWRYRFDPEQETKLDVGSKVVCAPRIELKGEIVELDRGAGTLLLKVGATSLKRAEATEPPAETGLAPDENVEASVLERAIEEVVAAWRTSGNLASHLDDFLSRRAPRLRGGVAGAPVVRAGEDLCAEAVRVAKSLDASTLVVQGPPGAGKTFAGARMILGLVAAGKRVGVVSNSHKAIENLLLECRKHAGASKLRTLKVGGDAKAWTAAYPEADHAGSADAEASFENHDLVGGTAWFFARDGVAGGFDHLFVDEAGQTSLANLVAVSRAARNFVLLGDQMQLGQPTQGTHPGESGLSALDYFLEGRATIPPELGVFLAESWRMHPDVCRFVSGAFYEDRLRPRPGTERRVVRVPADGGRLVRVEAGLVYVPVEHEGNAQASDEEVAVVVALFKELLGREKTDRDGKTIGRLDVADLLVVAPYNLQVRRLRRALPDGARVGSVDLFQGQEAPVAIVSMCASDAESSPRGLDFLFDRRRLNVAVSRAQSLAIVVGSPALARARCTSVEQLSLVNTYCRVLHGR